MDGRGLINGFIMVVRSKILVQSAKRRLYKGTVLGICGTFILQYHIVVLFISFIYEVRIADAFAISQQALSSIRVCVCVAIYL